MSNKEYLVAGEDLDSLVPPEKSREAYMLDALRRVRVLTVSGLNWDDKGFGIMANNMMKEIMLTLQATDDRLAL